MPRPALQYRKFLFPSQGFLKPPTIRICLGPRPAPLMIAVCVGLVSPLTTNLMWGFLTGFILQGVFWTSTKMRDQKE
jgi:hypothetical protein